MKSILRLKGNKYRLFYLVPIGLLMLGFLLLGGVYFVSFLMGPPELANDQNTIYYSTDGEIIGQDSGAENRNWADLEDISPHLVEATLAIEDRHFYDHNGFDLQRIVGAAISDIRSLSLDEGASTLSQQYARNLFLTHDKTWARKLKEAFYTVRLEMYYTKDELLEGYLNTIYYGHGAYGAETASRHFFDKPASDLTLAEASMLAAIPKGPSYYSPFNHMENAKDRQRRVLSSMREINFISGQAYYLSSREKLAFTETEQRENVSVAPYFQDAALNEASGILDLDAEKIRSGGYKIHTTLDKQLQDQLKNNTKNEMASGSSIEIGAIALNPDTGGIRALIGGKNYTESPFNRATSAKRMPGSAFKPFLYYAALNNGYTPATMLMSKPTAFRLEDGEVYQPSNYNGYYANEQITLAQALALSDNVYAVKTNLYLGPDHLANTAETFGFSGDLPAVPSLALGTAAVTVEEMVTGYGMLANGGHDITSHTVAKIVDRNGNTVFERNRKESDQVLDAQSVFVLSQLMTGMFDRSLDGYMTVTGSSIADQLNRTYAGKSGTTETDSWMVGYSPSLVTGIWTGYDDNKQITKTREEAYAKNIWASFMTDAHEDIGKEKFDIPSGVTGVPIDPKSGKRATSYCDTSRVMYFKEGTEPREHCTIHMPEDQGQPEEEEKNEKEEQGLFEKVFDTLF
ncbi:transglycosylase domain-containing protein [Lentibacillus amyloliquefaciens]|uniref:Monofunctional biosynthetic peptidoglycan transglycosylase n=1 Tax=Lentibacillus amyloliquefaciens TaxID=1472767 RepID=A0A0U3W9U6_9BACI|nr:PBP1A family penicillin-binding protein [Lentibacillus amyloliquefaciens]ALX49856.1 monofunctional biosynthetic peptidoglycan transglycosylase [Lentibacillus amyloliquefaciens]